VPKKKRPSFWPSTVAAESVKPLGAVATTPLESILDEVIPWSAQRVELGTI
jgi:hypothetical protein